MHDLRILTLNCWNGRAHSDAIARFLVERSVDVACLQELTPAQAGAVHEVLPFGKLEPGIDHCGMGIAARFSAEVQHLPLPQRDAQVTNLDPAAWPQLPASLQVVNLHIRAPHTRPWHAAAVSLIRTSRGRRSSRSSGPRPLSLARPTPPRSSPRPPTVRTGRRTADRFVTATITVTRHGERSW